MCRMSSTVIMPTSRPAGSTYRRRDQGIFLETQCDFFLIHIDRNQVWSRFITSATAILRGVVSNQESRQHPIG